MFHRNIIIACTVLVPLTSSTPDPIKTAVKIRRFAELPTVLFEPVVYRDKYPKTDNFDYVVVGASPSGCVIANRLTEDPSTTVLVLEAGKEDNVLTDVPVLNPVGALTDFSWSYDTLPTGDACLGMNQQRCPWPSGKGPGGGTIINAMVWTRGNRFDFDGWARMGLEGWSYEDVLPYFKKSENTRIPELAGSYYHGNGGELSIDYPPYRTPISPDYINAGLALGYREVDYLDPNTHIGFGRIQSSMDNGERVTAATAFLKPILKRPNLSISLYSRAIKILIDPATMRAYGVRYIFEEKIFEVYARKEVIVSAGAFGSPHLLMLSGIGPARHLHDVGIRPLVDLPVGGNLMEHPGMHGLVFRTDVNVTLPLRETLRNLGPAIAEYATAHDGVLTAPGCEAVAYVRTKYANCTTPDVSVPDIEFLFVSAGLNVDRGLIFRKTFGISDELYDYTYKPFDEHEHAFSIWPMLMYPLSRGSVRLKDDNPLSKPIIDHGFFTDPVDVKTLVEALKLAVRLAETPPLRKYGARLIDRPFPNCRHIRFGSDEYWECAVRTMSTQFHHQSGTCAMGSVVDGRLRVIGVRGLRVADASVMPTIPGAHIQAAAYMIGEKAADLIREDDFNNNR
ncbi:glucose dehydrogenase [Nesidiocoris tenuis]|uniref:Glucose dehydrogenase n=1 Tax=Nesidiocoris tenuis TaxID=355587 RepID=A0ABN7BC78_9HEMI|nr:glucose dehydrogenase [Nesidiocoris tenuis]